MDRQLSSILSLCQRAGKLVSGEFMCETAVKSKKSKLIILSIEASANTAKKFHDKTSYYKIPIVTVDCTKSELGNVIGKEERVVLSIIDTGFAEKLYGIIKQQDYSGYVLEKS